MYGVITCLVVPASSFTDCVPLRFRAGVGNACQAGATAERMISKVRDAIRDCDARQVGAKRECIISNARNAISNRDARQAGAIIERILIDGILFAVAGCGQGQVGSGAVVF